jgi:SAM-dependent methyltransferase
MAMAMATVTVTELVKLMLPEPARAQCPSCSSGQTVPVAERQFMIVHRCQNCALDFAMPDGHAASSAFATDPTYYHDSKVQFSRQLERARALVGERLKIYAKMLGYQPQRVLEIGCGSGAYGQAFSDCQVSYCAVEIDPEMAAFAHKASGQKVISGDFLDVDLPWRPDIVFLSQVLEHMPRPLAFVKRLQKVAPGAILHVDVPNQSGAASLYRMYKSNKFYGSMHYPFHMIGYSSESLHQLFKSGGIEMRLLRSYRNDHPVWGHLSHNNGIAWRTYYRLSQLLDRASLLVAVGIIPESCRDLPKSIGPEI